MMAGEKLLVLFVSFACVSLSLQKCFQNHCAHHSLLASCVEGEYLCQADEFCQVETHVDHGNSPWFHMNCRPNDEMADCLATYSTNNADCDPLKHGIACHWCCPDAACVQTLSTGVYNPPALPTTSLPVATTAPAVQTNPPAMTSAAPMMTSAPMMTTQAAAMTTIPPDPVQSTAAACSDLYLGDCTTDFAGRCAEVLVKQLCAKTCNVC